MRHPGPSALPGPLGMLLLFAAAGCGHSEPFGTDIPDPLGPPSTEVPRQLTFNPGDDRSPTVTGSAAAYSRRVPEAPYGAACIAIIPAAGGTIASEFCPPGPSPADTFVSNWVAPALSPDGARIAFVWRRSARVSYLGWWTQHLVVSPADTPAAPQMTHLLAGFLEPGNRQVTTATELSWSTPTTLRFLAAHDSIFKVKDGGASRFTDTVTVPRALMELDVVTGAVALVPGGDGVMAYAVGGDGTLWIVPDTARDLLMRLDADGTRTAVGVFPHEVLDLAAAGSRVAATGFTDEPAFWTDSLYWLDPAGGARGGARLPGTGRRMTAAASGDLILEIERGFDDGFGAPANLWLLRLAGTPAIR